MKLYGTFPSHFTRKVRILLQELGLEYEFIPAIKLMETGAQHFADNPLHQIPVLVDEGRHIIESDVIFQYLLEKHPTERVRLFPEGDRWDSEKRLAIMNGAMASGVKLIRAMRSEIPEYMSYPMFQQERAALAASLSWLDQDLNGRLRYSENRVLTLLDIALMSLLEWAVFREFVPSLQEYPSLQRFVAANCAVPSFLDTHPAKTFS